MRALTSSIGLFISACFAIVGVCAFVTASFFDRVGDACHTACEFFYPLD